MLPFSIIVPKASKASGHWPDKSLKAHKILKIFKHFKNFHKLSNSRAWNHTKKTKTIFCQEHFWNFSFSLFMIFDLYFCFCVSHKIFMECVGFLQLFIYYNSTFWQTYVIQGFRLSFSTIMWKFRLLICVVFSINVSTCWIHDAKVIGFDLVSQSVLPVNYFFVQLVDVYGRK